MPTVPSIEIAEVPGKGKGVVAKEHISRSTLIISEKPRITMPIDNFGIVKALHSMSEKDVAFFMSFPGSDDDPIKGRLKHFIPCEGDNCFGLCETICRVNHVCYSPMGGPNAAYYWNTSSKEEGMWLVHYHNPALRVVHRRTPCAQGNSSWAGDRGLLYGRH
jgi:hypothetical protein